MYCLDLDQTYKQKEMKNHIDGMNYLIDISTKLKGPIYTMSNHMPANTIDEFKIGIELIYTVDDCPYSDASKIYYQIKINGVEKFFSIYPLILQMITYNFYCDDFTIITKRITITEIEIQSPKLDISISENDDDRLIKKAFSKLGMNTNVNKFINNKFIILTKNNEWFISNKIPNDFYRVGIPILGTESLYLLTKKQYSRISKIQKLSITTGNTDSYSNKNVYIDGYNEFSILEANFIECKSLAAILQTCLFFPQMLSMELAVYGMVSDIEITVILDNGIKYNVNISENEISNKLFNLFDILNNIVKQDNILTK